MLDVALLGTGGMVPTSKRFLSSALFRLNGRLLLIDCGEGVQVSLKMLGWGFKNIDTILFTHYHGDHITGLPGILLGIANSGRQESINLVGPLGLLYFVDGFLRVCPELPYNINYIEIDGPQNEALRLGEYSIESMANNHSMPCLGYSISVDRKGKFDIKRAISLGLPKHLWSQLQKNKIVKYKDKKYDSKMVLGEARPGIKVSYITDSRPTEQMYEFVKGSQLFICEGMYGDDESIDKAIKNKHMVFSEAAQIAKKGDVGELWLTHFSPSISDPEEFAKNAQSVFSNTVVGYDRMFTTIYFE